MRMSDARSRFLLSTGMLSSALLHAQIDRAGLTGTVRDTAGRRVPAAHVSVISYETGLTREAVTSASGAYDVPELPIGRYSV